MKYVILTNFISGIGGAQQYIRNKVVELEKRGFDVIVFHAKKSEICIKELQKYEDYFIPELRYPPCCFSKKTISNVVDKIVKVSNGIDENSVVESSCTASAEWGELIAQTVKCKNVCLFVDERFSIADGEKRFLKFKLDRKELAGTSKESIPLMLRPLYCVSDSECYSFQPLISNVVENIDHPMLEAVKRSSADYIIGVLGRLEKEYVINSLRLIRNYVRQYEGKQFLILVVGGCREQSYYCKIKKIFSQVENANVIITGNLFPIPRQLLKKMDVCVSSAASARLTANESVPTIYVNCFSGKPVGIMNYTISMLDDQSLRYCEDYIDMNGALDDILLKKYCENNIPMMKPEIAGFSESLADETTRELDFIFYEKTKKYYDTVLIKRDTLKLKLFSIIGHLLGGRGLYFVHIQLLPIFIRSKHIRRRDK